MIPLVEQARDAVQALCRRYHVARLEVFGSAAARHTDDEARDLDFLVTFQTTDEMGPADQYFGLLFDLEKLFGRPIDLVCASVLRNEYFIQEVNRSRTTLYAA